MIEEIKKIALSEIDQIEFRSSNFNVWDKVLSQVDYLPIDYTQEILKYKHVPNEVWYNKDNTDYKVCDDSRGEDDSCSNSCGPLHCDSIDNHMNYMGVNMGSEGDC